MSYCRYSADSDVYVIGTKTGWACLGCSGLKDSSSSCKTREEMLGHLLKHREEGHKVPDWPLDRLRKEITAE